MHPHVFRYLLVFILCSVPGMINRLMEFIGHGNDSQPVYWLECLDALFGPLQVRCLSSPLLTYEE
jgi:hypothetical protein